MTPLGVTRLGDGPPLAMVHGWGFAAPALRELAEALATRRTVELVDLPGHGASRGMPMPPDLPGLADLLDATLPATRDWVGWSLGGLACLQLALARPGRVNRLALLAASPRFTVCDGWANAMPVVELEAFASALVDDPRTTLNRFAALVAHGDEEARAVLRRLRDVVESSGHPDPDALATGLDLLAEGDLASAARQASGPPTLWVLGSEDALVPASLAVELDSWPGSEVELLDGAGHAPFVTRPTACANRLERFLDG